MLFITRVALCKYRSELPGFELPQPVHLAQQEFDECLATKLEGMAARLEGKTSGKTQDMEACLVRLEESVGSVRLEQEPGATNTETFLVLSRRIESLAASLDKEI
jgi:hypothetical protein